MDTDVKKTPGELEIAILCSMHAMTACGWGIPGVPVEFHKINDVVHVDDDDMLYDVYYVDGMRYILVPLDNRTVEAMSFLDELDEFKDYSISYLDDISPGANVLIDASDQFDQDIPARFRKRLAKAVSYKGLLKVHESYHADFLKMSSDGTLSDGAFRSAKRGRYMVLNKYEELSQECAIKYALIKRLPSKCGVSIPNRCRNSHGVDIGGGQNLFYVGDDVDSFKPRDFVSELNERYGRSLFSGGTSYEGGSRSDVSSGRTSDKGESLQSNDNDESFASDDEEEDDMEAENESKREPDSSSDYCENADERSSDEYLPDDYESSCESSSESSRESSSASSSESSSESSSKVSEKSIVEVFSSDQSASSNIMIQDHNSQDSDDSKMIKAVIGSVNPNEAGEDDPDVQLVDDLRRLG